MNGEKHVAFNIGTWVVEVHGSMPTMITPRIDRMITRVQNSIFYGGEVRSWNNSGTCIFLPAPDNDVIFVFTHFIKHFLRTEGVGLRQICDWCRLLWTYRETLNYILLESRIKEAGLVSEWRAFAALAEDWLGMPVEAMPLYSDSKCWKRKASRILACILETGNFGHNRDNSFYQSQSLIKRKAMSFWRQTKDSFRHLFIFPGHTIFIWFRTIVMGFWAVFRRE